MPRLPLALALAAAATLGGCYRYDMRATNSTPQDVRISLHRGKKQHEISTVVLVPGASVGWFGDAQKPLVLRIATEPGEAQVVQVVVPKKLHTEFDVVLDGSLLTVTSDQLTTYWTTGAEFESGAADGASGAPAQEAPAQEARTQEAPTQEAPAEPAYEAEPAGSDPAVDLVEPDGSGG